MMTAGMKRDSDCHAFVCVTFRPVSFCTYCKL